MKFSIVIPTYNNKFLLRNTLEALNYQTGYGPDDYEVVIVDDGSTDGTREYVAGVNKNYSVQYTYLERTPLSCRSKTRNAGLKLAKGDVVAFIDSDILVRPDYLSEVDRYFSASSDIVLLGNRIMLEDQVMFDDIASGQVFRTHGFDPTNYNILDYRHYIYELYSYSFINANFPWLHVYSCNLVVARKWLLHVGGFDEHFIEWGIEDIEIGYALYASGLNIFINSKLEVLHQNHGPRNDLIIEDSKKDGYIRNVEYFQSKHPAALPFKRGAHKFLMGELPFEKFSNMMPAAEVRLVFDDASQIDHLKNQILQFSAQKGFSVVVEDNVECSDLDIWIQLQGRTPSHILYFPASRRIDATRMKEYIDAEKNRQKERGQQKTLQR